MKNNNYLIFINLSPWPLLMCINSFNLFIIMIFNMNYSMNFMSIMQIMLIINILMMWNYNSNMNKMLFGYKNFMMNLSMKMSMMMFIMSEMMFFLTFFYIYFSNKMFNNFFYKKMYMKMFKLNFLLSLMNLMILMSSSITLMIFINKNMKNKMNKFMMYTILLSIYFLLIQLMEYKFMNFNSSNSIMFSNFFTLTSFHMTHVIIGTMMMINFMMIKIKFMYNYNIKMMNMCWYWHFIDFIWIMIFTLIY